MPVDLTKNAKKTISKNLIVSLSVAAGSLILAVILWVVLISPKVSAIRELKQKIKSVSSLKNGDVAFFAREKETLTKNKAKINSKVAVFKRRLSEEKDVPTLLDKLILTARRRKLEFTYIKPLKRKDKILEDEGVKMFIKEIPVSLEMEAGFAEFLGFLWETEHSDDIFKITGLSIEPNPKNPARHKEKLTLSIYQLVEEGRE